MNRLTHYLLSRKEIIASEADWSARQYTHFISAYNDTERVQAAYRAVNSANKLWVALSEYGYREDELPAGQPSYFFPSIDESVCIRGMVESMGIDALRDGVLCIDITGFMRQHILFLVKYLKHVGVKSFDVIYSEPNRYERRENTVFSTDDVAEVRAVSGFAGSHSLDVSSDCLVLGVGYDHNPSARVLISKERTRLIQLHSLPSLSADMYQESVLRMSRVEAATSKLIDDGLLFSNANDPFTIASVLGDALTDRLLRGSITNLYLSPLATKPQALGFAIYYVTELEELPVSILLPITHSYSRQTSRGIGSVWRYEIAF